MVLLPEDAAMTLQELRQMAARQQHQIEAQQQLLVAKEQRLKFLKQQEARHHNLELDSSCLQNLRDKIETQELKLRRLRELRGQVEQQKTNNDNLGTELDSIRALFSEKEKELNLAVNKVDELSRQLDEIRNNKNRKTCFISSTAPEIESLRRELMYRTKLSEQQNAYICQQRDDIALRHQDIALLDQKINELTLRLHRKRLLNDQLAAQIHNAALSRTFCGAPSVNNGFFHATTVVAVEPLPRDTLLEVSEQTRDDISAKLRGSSLQGDLGEFNLNKNDPKYQTLPYNTKFTLKGKCEDSSHSSSNEEDSWSNSLDSSDSSKRFAPPLSIVKPSTVTTSGDSSGSDSVANSMSRFDDKNGNAPSQEKVVFEEEKVKINLENKRPVSELNDNVSASQKVSSLISALEKKTEKPKIGAPRSTKPAVPPKPALPVKPMIAHRTSGPATTDVNAALSVLQNCSSKNDKTTSNYRERLLYYQCVPRYLSAKDNTRSSPSSKSKIATYFHKTASDTSSQDSQKNENGEGEIPKRKAPIGQQLPIKPKPLTIRKTPGLEPPKLKVQPVVSTNFHRKNSDSSLSSQLKVPFIHSSSDSAISVKAVAKNVDAKVSENVVPVVEVAPLKNEPDISAEKQTTSTKSEIHSHVEEDASSFVKKDDCRDGTDEVDCCRFEKKDEKSDLSVEVLVESETEDERFHSAALRRMRKGNLKGENSSRTCRRVSFDPLALLLDAALEGELELVKKTAREVPNPSAANDEGITALHNAICAGHVDVATFLVDFGCDVNAQDCDGWTPLHCAASCNNLHMVKFLVERGACIFATTLSDQETAAEKCEEDEEGFDGCSEYLYSLQENLGVMNNGIVYAVYGYEVQNADELTFQDGDQLAVLRKGDDDESEWWWSRLSDEEGYVPRNLLGLYPRVTSSKDFESDRPAD